MGLPERTGYPAGWVGMQASERDRSVLALLTGNGAVSVHPDRIETSDRDTFHIGAWAAEIRAGTAVAVGAGVGNAASVACTFGLQRDCGADGVDAFVERLRAGAESLYRLDVRAGDGGRRVSGGVHAAGHDLVFSCRRCGVDHVCDDLDAVSGFWARGGRRAIALGDSDLDVRGAGRGDCAGGDFCAVVCALVVQRLRCEEGRAVHQADADSASDRKSVV